MRNSIFFMVLAVVFFSCSSTRKQSELLQQSKPIWLKQRPVNADYFYGIGVTPKIGAPTLFEDKAKERALADISGQINSTIKVEAVFYQVEDQQGVREYLQNRIKSTSSEYLEGYEYVDKWEDLSNTYAFYRLSKQKYDEVKIRRKNEALSLASDKYLAGILMLQDGEHIAAIENFAMAIDALSGYLNQSTTTEVQGKQIDLVGESTYQINAIIKGLHFDHTLELFSSEEGYYVVCDAKKEVVSNMPIYLKYSGGYLSNDKIKTNNTGFVILPKLPASSNQANSELIVQIDLINLGRQVTRNLYVRKIIEQQKADEIVVKMGK